MAKRIITEVIEEYNDEGKLTRKTTTTTEEEYNEIQYLPHYNPASPSPNDWFDPTTGAPIWKMPTEITCESK